MELGTTLSQPYCGISWWTDAACAASIVVFSGVFLLCCYLFCLQLRCSRLGKTNTWLIPIGELNAGSFKSALNHVERCTSRLAYPRLQLMDGHDPQASAFGKLLLAPSEQSPCCPALSRRKHFIRLPEASDFTIP